MRQSLPEASGTSPAYIAAISSQKPHDYSVELEVNNNRLSRRPRLKPKQSFSRAMLNVSVERGCSEQQTSDPTEMPTTEPIQDDLINNPRGLSVINLQSQQPPTSRTVTHLILASSLAAVPASGLASFSTQEKHTSVSNLFSDTL